jgi:hypothetical protein
VVENLHCIERAATDGVDADKIEEARDEDDPRAALTKLILSEKANLANLTTKQLRGMLPRRFF